MGRPREHDDSTAQALLAAAEATMQAGGISALTVRGVADDVGTTTRAVYSLFGSRDGLLLALGIRAFDLLGAGLQAQPETDDPVGDLVETGVSVWRCFVVDHPALFRIGFRSFAGPELDAQLSPARLRAAEGLIAKVARLAQADLLGGRSLDEAVLAFDALCEGLAELDLRGNFPPGKEELRWRDALTALVSGWQSARVRARASRAQSSAEAVKLAFERRSEESRHRRQGP